MTIPKSDFMTRRMKNITQRQFRFLLTLYIALTIISIPLGMITDHWLLPQSLQDYLNTNRINYFEVRPKGLEL
jgi:hypothetical protein